MTLREILDYEVASSWWAPFVGLAGFRDLAAWYFAKKAQRKYKRWQELEEWKRRYEWRVKE